MIRNLKRSLLIRFGRLFSPKQVRNDGLPDANPQGINRSLYLDMVVKYDKPVKPRHVDTFVRKDKGFKKLTLATRN